MFVASLVEIDREICPQALHAYRRTFDKKNFVELRGLQNGYSLFKILIFTIVSMLCIYSIFETVKQQFNLVYTRIQGDNFTRVIIGNS